MKNKEKMGGKKQRYGKSRVLCFLLQKVIIEPGPGHEWDFLVLVQLINQISKIIFLL